MKSLPTFVYRKKYEMSPYAKQTWANGNASTPLSAARLNHIEAGVEAAMAAAESAEGTAGPAGTITSVSVIPLSSGATPTVALGGTPSARTITLGIPAGATGEAAANPIALYAWTGSAWSPDPSLGVPSGTLYRHFRGPAPYMGDTIVGVYDEYFPTA